MLVNDTKRWPELRLKGNRHVIPKVCPNCLAHAPLEFRYSHKRVNQSFFYCEKCSESVSEELKLEKRGWLLLLPLGYFSTMVFAMAWVGLVLGLFAQISRPAKDTDTTLSTIVFLGSLVIGTLVVYLAMRYLLSRVARWLRSRAMHRVPPREGQVTWGRAAVCAQPSVLSTVGAWRYKAVRPEWIQALAEANPISVC